MRCFFAVKSVSTGIEQGILYKIGFVADYEGRSVNSHIFVLIGENIKIEEYSGKAEGKIHSDVNVKPTRIN